MAVRGNRRLEADLRRALESTHLAARVPVQEAPCSHAQAFGGWAEELLATAQRQETGIALNQAKAILLDRYFQWRATVPKAHRDCTGERGHRCIWHVFADAYERLRAAELALAPPPLAEAPPPQPEAGVVDAVRGIYLAPPVD